MTQLQAIRQFADYVAGEHVIIPKQRGDWQMGLGDPKPRLTVPLDPNQNDEADELFRENFVKRCPIAQEFANVTLSILHEIGHHFNREVAIFADKLEGDTQEEHFSLPHEVVATDWAIRWLHNKEHRKQAKAFERLYFGYN